MKVETLIENLERTIQGKVAYYESLEDGSWPEQTTAKFLLLNIQELRNILEHVRALEL